MCKILDYSAAKLASDLVKRRQQARLEAEYNTTAQLRAQLDHVGDQFRDIGTAFAHAMGSLRDRNALVAAEDLLPNIKRLRTILTCWELEIERNLPKGGA